MQDLLSIGLPVYNEENFISETLNSILSQTYTNFELIISDNNSTDSTKKIIEKFEKKDKRINFIKNKDNIGMINNFNLVFKKSKGKYFMWAGAHDILNQNYVKFLIEELEKNSNRVTLAFSDVGHIDNKGEIILKHKNIGFDNGHLGYFSKNLKLPFMLKNSGDMVYGVFQRKHLPKTKLLSKMLWPDVLLIHEVSAFGKIKKINSPLRYRRYPNYIEPKDSFEVNKPWNEKYKIKVKNQRKSIKNKVTWDLYLPTLVLSIKIFLRLGLFKIHKNPLSIFWALYFSLVFLWKHRYGFLIDFRNFGSFIINRENKNK